MPKEILIEVCRSYSQKVSHPKNRYENSDFFCSAKIEVPEKQIKKASEKLDKFVQDEVLTSVRNWQLENMPEPKEELQYEPIKPTAEEREMLQKEADRIIAEGETDKEKQRRWEAEQQESPIMSPKDDPNYEG